MVPSTLNTLNAVLMVECVSWHAPLCLLINWWLLSLQFPAMCVQESGNPHSGHAFVGASLYLCANFPLYTWPYMYLSMYGYAVL